MSGKASRKGLSPLLAIIIGLVVTIVAGILLAQLYFSYAATISARPAANVEYVDLVVPVGGGTGTLAINLKNTGNVRINSVSLTSGSGGTIGTCSTVPATIPPGGTGTTTCGVTGATPGGTLTATLRIGFEDGSYQSYLIAIRARIA